MLFTYTRGSHLSVLMVNWLYPPEFSGAAAQCHTLAKELVSYNVDVEVLSGTNKPEWVGTDFVDGIKVHRVLCDKSNRKRSGKYSLDMFSYIFKNRAKYNIIHSHGFITQANLAAKVTALPLVLKITNLNLDDPFSVSRRSMGQAFLSLYRTATAVVATSLLLYEITSKMFAKKVRIEHIPNGVDINRFTPATTKERLVLKKRLGLEKDDCVQLFVGTICYNKGLDLLIKAMKLVRSQTSRNVQLLVVGPDDYVRSYGDSDPQVIKYADDIRREVETSGLGDMVRFEGRQAIIEDYYKAADIYIHPSRRDGQPNALIEAMSSGLPVVVNSIPGITTEMADYDHSGYVINCEDSQLLADKIVLLAENPDLRQQMGLNARKDAMARYYIKDIARRYFNLYKDIAGYPTQKMQWAPRYESSGMPKLEYQMLGA